jgi:hypothetical protein
MKLLATAVLMACMLSATARAGEVPSTGGAAPQPSSSTGLTGEIPTGGTPGITGEILGTGGDSTAVLTIILTLISTVR